MREITIEHVLASMCTLMTELDFFTFEEVKDVLEQGGYQGLYTFLNDLYLELIEDGVIEK